MDDRPPAPAYDAQWMLDDRYQIEGALGRGGMATVYAATDTLTGERLAVKRLRTNDREHLQLGIAQFRREYELLVELCHPSIIRVFDYGVDAAGPYYTMELLDGESLGECGRLPFREACRLLRDIASSLAVVHARRLVHRDVSLRNIHRTREGSCKLLDFGAVTSMGVATSIVGTPPYLPPEALAQQPLDGRADLFALGAALYRLLTGRHAYPAKRIDELRDQWTRLPPSPHELASDVPLALSQLTMVLLSLDPLGRPHSAAEVMHHLSVLSGLDLHEPGAVRRAFFTTPVLVGRAGPLQQVRVFLEQAAASRGGVLAITGPLGVGRTRMLEACVTQARLLGVAVLNVQANDPQDAYGLLHALAQSARERLPEARDSLAAQRLWRLLMAVPKRKLVAEADAASFAGHEPGSLAPKSSSALRRELQDAARDCCLAWAARRPLLLAIDDVERADEPSLACLAALTAHLHDAPLLIAVSSATDRIASASARATVDWLCNTAARVDVPSLTRSQVLELLSSIFGEVPNVAVLAARIHAVSGGQPQWVMQLAEHLVECGAVRYEAGAFIISDRLRIEELPHTLSQALQTRLATLGAAAREVAHAFMLDPQGWFAPSELASVCGMRLEQMQVLVDELVARGVLVRDRAGAGLRHRAWIGNRLASEDADAEVRWHERLGELFLRRGDAARAARHLWAAGKREPVLAVLVDYCDSIDHGLQADPSLLDHVISVLPADFIDLLCDVIDARRELGMTKRAEAMLRLTCVRIGALICDPRASHHVRALFAMLRIETGLEAWEQLGHLADPKQRLVRALEQTKARYESVPEAERCFPVPEAIRVLSVVRGHGIGIYAQTRDFELAALLPSLAPLTPLSPTLAMTQELTETVDHLMAGRYHAATAGYLRIVEQLDGEAGAAIDPSGHRFNRFGCYYPLAMIAADRGQEAALAWAEKLEAEPLFEVTAWRVRMAFHRACGDDDEAERCRKQAELLRIAHRPHELYGTGAVSADLFQCIATEDLVGLKRVLDELESVAARFPGWRPVLRLAQGEYCRLSGDHASALSYFETVLAACVCGRDALWQAAAAAYLSTLFALGQLERGRALGHAWLRAADAADLRDGANAIPQRVALIEAGLGNASAAVALAERGLQLVEALQITGMRAGGAHEARARVAILLGDRAGFERHLEYCARYFRSGKSAALWARYERIVRDARAAGMLDDEPPKEVAPAIDASGHAELQSRVRACADASQRAAIMVEALSREAGARGGILYVAAGELTTLRAIHRSPGMPARLDDEVERLWRRVHGDGLDSTVSASAHDVTLEAPLSLGQREYPAFLLTHTEAGNVVLAGVVLLRGESGRLSSPSGELLRLCARLLLEVDDVAGLPIS